MWRISRGFIEVHDNCTKEHITKVTISSLHHTRTSKHKILIIETSEKISYRSNAKEIATKLYNSIYCKYLSELENNPNLLYWKVKLRLFIIQEEEEKEEEKEWSY